SFSDVGGLVGNVSIAKGVTLENAIGGSGHDSIIGNQANNVLKGGAGADRLRGAGGADTFAYDNASDSTPEYPDQIMDFVTGVDRIDLSNLLGNAGVDALRFVRRLTGKPGEAILDYNRTTNLSRLAIDLTGNGRFDFFLKAYGPINVPDIITANPGRQRYA
ncbi:type I secretion C-terminal target domain-containing protein, partial [Pseudomonas sp. PA-3-10C]